MKKSKLVRDNIPDIVAEKWELEEFYESSNDEEYLQKLIEKIFEELEEVMSAPREKLAEELADLKEVILTIAKFKNILIEKLDIDNTFEKELKSIKVKIESNLGIINFFAKSEGISLDEIEEKRIQKKKLKWGFDKRIILVNN